MWNSDTISGLIVLAITGFAYSQANFSYYGGVFVYWVLLILSILGIALLVKGLTQKAPFQFWEETSHRWQVLIVTATLALYIIIIKWAGFLASSLLVYSGLCLILSPANLRKSWRGWVLCILVGTTVTLLFYGIFKHALLVPLPEGTLFN